MKSLTSIVFAFVLMACAGCPVKSDASQNAPVKTAPQSATTQPAQKPTTLQGVSVTPDGTVHAGPGQSVVIEQRDVVDDVGNTLSRSDKAAAKGTDVSAIGQEVKTSTENQPSKVALGDTTGGGVDGGESAGEAGGSRTEMKIIGIPPKQAGLYLFGGLLVAIGVGLCVYELLKPGVASIVAGLALIVCGVLIDTAPWVFIVAGLIGVAWLAYLVIHTVSTHKTATATAASANATQTALGSYVSAEADLAKAYPAIASWFASLVNHHTDKADDPTVANVVGQVKADLNLNTAASTAPLPPAPAPAPGTPAGASAPALGTTNP